MARHCMPQKQTHQIAITALRNAAPASGGFGPDLCDRVPSLAIAVSSASTSSTKPSTSANASQGPGDVFAGRTAVPILCGLDAVDDGLRDGLSSFPASRSIQPQVAVALATGGVISLQTDTQLRCRTTATDGEMRQDKLFELRTLQLRRKRLPPLSFRHSGPRKKPALPDPVASAEIPGPRRPTAKFNRLQKPATSCWPSARGGEAADSRASG
ncbi:MAG: hypothetical protein QOG25_2802 [Acetobacteraceae bacterium]|nr:hypothetical protein [Acetobacteraceae bacterium]